MKEKYGVDVHTSYKDYAVYQHVIGTEIRYFDENGNGSIMDGLIKLAG